jgi:hypothetical protein
MKKSIILIALLTAMALPGMAQHFGIQAGGMLSNVRWRNEYFTLNTLPKEGFMAGVALDIPVAEKMSILTALNYKWIGTVYNDTSDVSSMQLGYVNLDITFNYVFTDVKVVHPYVEGGTYVAYMVNSNRVIKAKDDNANYDDLKVGTSETDHIKPWDFGWTIGGGVYLDEWKFGAGYQASMINLSPNSDYVLRNSAGYLRVTYFFNRN